MTCIASLSMCHYVGFLQIGSPIHYAYVCTYIHCAYKGQKMHMLHAVLKFLTALKNDIITSII